MKIKPLQNIRQLRVLLLGVGFLVFFLGITNSIWAQTKILAQYESKSSRGVSDETNVNAEDETYAEVKAYGGAALGLGAYSGEITMKFDQTLPADQWSYIRVELDGGLVDVLLGGSLGDLLGGVVGGIALGELTVEATALNSGTEVLKRNSDQGFNTDRVRLIETGDDHYLIGLRPNQNYNQLRFKASSITLLLGTVFENKVFYAFTYDPNDPAGDCGRPLATSFDGGGLDLGLLNLDDQHLDRAIDDDMDSYSTLDNSSLLGLSVAGSLSQYFYFPTESSETASVNIKLGMGASGLLDLDLLGATEVIFYQGEDIVHERSLKSGLLGDTNALNLLDSGNPVMLTFAPGRAFDRIEFRLNSPVGLSLINAAFRIYDVQRYDDTAGCINPEIPAIPAATADPFDVPSCATDLIDFKDVDFAQRAVDGNNESYATIYASSGELLGGSPFAGYIEMDLGHVNANQTTYVRIGYDEDVLDRLLGGSLGVLVADLANDLLLGNQYIQVQAKNGNTIVLDEDSSQAFEGTADGVVTIVEDNIGRYYLAITPDSDYDRIRITNHVTAVLPTGKQASLDVYNACYETGDDSCFPANFTSYKGGGINLSIGDLSDVGVKDPYKAISENSSEYSEINLGVTGIAANVYQTIYFNQPSQPDDHVQIRLMVEPSSTLSLDLLGAYKIKFFKGNEQVGPDYGLQNGLLNNIDLLALFNSGGTVTLDFEPEDTFDRVDIGAETTVQLNVAAEPLRIYSVKRYGDQCPLTTAPSPFEAPSCSTELVDSQNADDVQNLFDDDFDSFATLYSGKQGLLGLGGEYEGFVEMEYPNPVDAEITSYIRIDFDEDILNALISGGLGNIAADLLNNLLLDDHYFEVQVKDASENIILSGSSKEANTGGNGRIRVVQDKLGRYYIAVTPDQDYKSVRITDKTDALINLTTEGNSMNVYGMCYETSPDMCLDAFATSYEYNGLNLGVDDLGAAGVTNPEYALDDNTQHYSEISNGTLGVGASTKQWIFFNTVSEANDATLITFSTEQGGADLDVLGGLEIIAYKGETPVDTLDWQNGIVNGVNVLNLISNNQNVEVPFAPGAAYDRISIGIRTLLNVSVFPPVHLYSVERCYDIGTPEFIAWKSYVVDGDPSLSEVKGGEEVEYTIHIRNTGTIDIHDLVIKDELPENTTYVSGGTEDAGVVTFTGVDVLAGETETLSFTVQVEEDLTGVDVISNTALVKLDSSDPGEETYPPIDNEAPDDPDDSGDTGTDIPVDKIYEVESWKAYEVDGDASVTEVSGGETITYKIYVRNTGNQALTNITVSDELPEGVTYVSGGNLNGNQVEFTISNLGYGETSSALSFKVRVDEDLTDIEEIKNIAVSSSTDLTDTESYPPVDNENPDHPDTTKDTGTIVDVAPIHSIEFSKIGVSNGANSGQAEGDDVITYTLTVKNTGNKTLENVQINDAIPAYTTIENTGDFTENSGIMEAVITSLAVNEEVSLSFMVRVDSNLDINVVQQIQNTADIDFSNEDNSGTYTETATYNMPTACSPLIASDVILNASNNEICEGEEVILTASTTQNGLVNIIYKWYKKADLSDTPFVGDELTTSLEETTIFYVTIEADGYCFNTPAAEIEVEVDDLPSVPTISISGDSEICEDDTTVLQADGSASSYIWFFNGQEIQGETGSDIVVNKEGNYTVSAVNANGCVSITSAEIFIKVNPLPDLPILSPGGIVEICEGETIEVEATVADGYEWYRDGVLIEDESGNPLNVQVLHVSEAGDYTVRVIDGNTTCRSEVSDVTTVVVNPAPEIIIDGNQFITVAVDQSVPWPTVTSTNGSISWLDEAGNSIDESDLPSSYNTVGTHTFTVIADNGSCESTKTITVNVYDSEACPVIMERVYASESSWGSIITGGVSDQENAVDGNVKTYSTIVTGIGALGIGTTWQTLKFDHTVTAGTPVTVKLGKEYSGLMLAGGLSVVGVKKNSLGDYIDIGVIQTVAGGLLDLLVADNVLEFTFVPSTVAGPQDYDGVRISQGALLSVAQNAKVYGAYYEQPGQPDCNAIDANTNPDVQDILHGVKDLGLGAASATASVVDPWNAVDGDLDSSAKIVRGVSALNAAFLTVVFKNQVMPTDSIQIIMKDPTNNGLTLDLLTGYQFQRYLGDTPVGEPIQGGNIIDLKLLSFTNDKKKLLVGSYDEPYDRLQIAYGSIVEAQLGDQVEIYDVSVRPTIVDENDEKEFEVCQDGILHIKQQDDCTVYVVYDENDNELYTEDGFDFVMPDNTIEGTYIYSVQAIRQGCEIGERIEIEVTVNAAPQLNGFEITINDDPSITYAPGNPIIEVDPGDIIIVHPDIDWGSNTTMDEVIWEMENPLNNGEWIEISFGEVNNTTDLTLSIPTFGEIDINGHQVDIRNTEVKLRAIMISDASCSTMEEMTLDISGKSFMISNPHIISK